jgi:ribosomal protein L7Ae-like RNA K-turn-binding protein
VLVKTEEMMAVKVTTPHCVKNATKRIKLIVLIASNVEEETTLPDIAGRETRGGYP